MSGSVRLTRVEPTPIAVVRARTTWAEFASQWGPMLDAVWSYLRGDAPVGLYRVGHNVMLYRDDVPNVEVGVQVTSSFPPAGAVVPSSLPGGMAASATHSGPVGQIGQTHSAITRWCEDNGHPVTGLRWEIYGDPDPSTGLFAVDVFWLLAEL